MSIYYVAGVPYSSELYHHGIKGQKWGRRNYQNPDGSLTPAGRERYGVGKIREQLGFGSKGLLNTVQRTMIKSYKKDMKKFEKTEKKIVKREEKGRDASKYIDRASAYLNSAKINKDLARTYASLTKTEQKAINRGYIRVRHRTLERNREIDRYRRERKNSDGVQITIGNRAWDDAKRSADTYLRTELLARKKK